MTIVPRKKQNACGMGCNWADLLRKVCAQVVGEERGTKHLSAGIRAVRTAQGEAPAPIDKQGDRNRAEAATPRPYSFAAGKTAREVVAEAADNKELDTEDTEITERESPRALGAHSALSVFQFLLFLRGSA